jgi:hypothetical protein
VTEPNGREDRFRPLPDALEDLLQAEDFPHGQVERFELYFHASGEVSWRVWTPRAEYPDGGILVAPDSS